jgi:uncharacterized heparinase superfamily protein
MRRTLAKIKRGLKKPPGYIAERLLTELRYGADRYFAPGRAARFTIADLLVATGDASVESLCERILARPHVAVTAAVDVRDYDRICPEDIQRVLAAAERACGHEIDLLGSGPVQLGMQIDWLRDYKTGMRWPEQYFRDIDYNNPDRPSDVKFPWELSRMQWLLPCAQAFLLTGDEKYAAAVRDVLLQWIESNPFAHSVNWACTMEVALRIVTWTWFFHVFARSAAWSQSKFREQFLRSLYLHALFAERNLEKSDINGNHYIADAAGLVFAGAFFGRGASAQRWSASGWEILASELPKQVFPDGVDYEGSIAYHRLVFEIFLLPALLRNKQSLAVPDSYWARLKKMAEFTAAYSRPDGSVPLVGDADDGRVLPFGGQGINDHRYLLGLAACSFGPEFANLFSGPRTEAFWLFDGLAASLPQASRPSRQPASTAFPDGGFYVLRNERDHVFIDCGPVGLAGRGGHGHNDLLSFEAVLDGVHLITDCGSYVYTADYAARQRFRSTANHNTPQIDGKEINRISADQLWSLNNDANFTAVSFQDDVSRATFVGEHTGFSRLQPGIVVRRSIVLEHTCHSLNVSDIFTGAAPVQGIQVPFHLSNTVSAHQEGDCILLKATTRSFTVHWNQGWKAEVLRSEVSPTYGVSRQSSKLLFTRIATRETELSISISPAAKC